MPREIDITIKKRRPMKDHGEQRPKRGPINTRRRDEIGRRRLSPTGLITFYDLGQIWNSETSTWDNNDFVYDPAPVVVPSPDPEHSSDGAEYSAPLDGSVFESLQAGILAVPRNEWLTKFRKIKREAGNAFPLLFRLRDYSDYDFSSAEWDTDAEGLRLTQADLNLASRVEITTLRHSFDPNVIEYTPPFLSDVKVTNFASYTAPEVVFTPGLNDVYFLMPSLCFSHGYSTTLTGPHSSIKRNLDEQWRTIPRDYSHPDKRWNWSVAAGPSTPEFDEALANHLALPAVRAVDYIFTGENYPPATGWVYRLAIDIGSASGFPIAESDRGVFIDRPAVKPGALLGVVKRTDQFFYFWTERNDGSETGPGGN